MFRKTGTKKSQQLRKRQRLSSEGSDEVDFKGVRDALVRRKRKNPMIQSTKKESKQKNMKTDSDESTSSLSDSEGPNVSYKTSGSHAPFGSKGGGATAVLQIDTDIKADAQAQFERIQKNLEEEEAAGTSGQKLYKGQAMYGAKKAKDTAKGNACSGLNRIGPVRAPQFLRQTVRWDYAPDICKDWKETGYCTFGDSCKFMHDRSDYKHGWELERDWEAKLKRGGGEDEERNYEINLDEDGLPDECVICEGPFKSPVVTKCKHYFCESCAIEASKKSKRCKVCQQPTGGVFNTAKNIHDKQRGEPSKGRRLKEEVEDEEDHVEQRQHTFKKDQQIKTEEGGYEDNEDQTRGDSGDEQKKCSGDELLSTILNEVMEGEDEDLENESDEDEEETEGEGEREIKQEPMNE